MLNGISIKKLDLLQKHRPCLKIR